MKSSLLSRGERSVAFSVIMQSNARLTFLCFYAFLTPSFFFFCFRDYRTSGWISIGQYTPRFDFAIATLNSYMNDATTGESRWN